MNISKSWKIFFPRSDFFFLPKLDNILQNEYHYITLYNRKGILIYDLTIFLGYRCGMR